MCRKFIWSILLLALLACPAFAANHLFNGSQTPDLNWTNPLNWDNGIVPTLANGGSPWFEVASDDIYPCIIDTVVDSIYSNVGLHGGANPVEAIVEIQTGGQWTTPELWLCRNLSGAGGDGTLFVNGGELVCTGGFRFNAGGGPSPGGPWTGTILVDNGGTVTASGSCEMGQQGGDSNIQIKSGTFTQDGTIRVAIHADSNSRIDVEGGTLTCNDMNIENGTALINVEAGTLIIIGDKTGKMEGYKDAGQLVGYDGLSAVDISMVEGNTVVTADPPSPNAPLQPNPQNSAKDVPVGAVLLSWRPGDNVQATAGHEVYFGTDETAVENATSTSHPDVDYFVSDTNSQAPGILQVATTYYWKVIEVNDVDKWEGLVWRFSTTEGKATNPIPADKVSQIPTDLSQLTWTASDCAVQQDFYIGVSFDDVNSSSTPTVADIAGEVNSVAVPIVLEKDKTYYWRIDTDCDVSGFAKGDVWEFSTEYGFSLCDDFEEYHDFLADGVQGTLWAGIIGADSAYVCATDVNDGKLYIEAGNNSWNSSNQGFLLYQEVSGPFIAEVELTDYSGLWTGDMVDHLNCGIMARVPDIEDAGPGEDYISISYFARWNGNRGDISGWYNDGTWDGYFGRMFNGFDAGRFLQMDYRGDGIFYLTWSLDGVTWQQLDAGDQPSPDGHQITVYPTIKEDMAVNTLQVGLWLATYSANIGVVEFDNFCISSSLQAKANTPQPEDGGLLDIMGSCTLSWKPGDLATGCELYFGTSYDDVNNATTTDPEHRDPANIQGPDANGRFSYDAGLYETLVIGQTYYWRVDETDGVHTWKGDVWEFTIQDYSTVDDFESYTGTGKTPYSNTPSQGDLRMVWVDGNYAFDDIPWPFTPGTNGSLVQLNTDTYDGDATYVHYQPEDIAQTGSNAMKFYYDNDGTVTYHVDLYARSSSYNYTPSDDPYLSEAYAAVDDAAADSGMESLDTASRDWSSYKLLNLPFYGDPNNDAEPMYVGLEDGDGTLVTIVYPDSNHLTEDSWHHWLIPTHDFVDQNANFDLGDVAKIYIGFGDKDDPQAGGSGVVFFDDVQLLAYGVCIPGSVVGDFDDDCTVNNSDLEILANNWLYSGESFTDNFSQSHDYLASGVSGTGWDGIVGEETAEVLNADMNRPGALTIQSSYGWWQGGTLPHSPFIYVMAAGDFSATVKVTDFSGDSENPVYHNDSGIMARVPNLDDAGPGEDWVSVRYFPTWVGNSGANTDASNRTEFGNNGKGWDADPYLKLERAGNAFHTSTSIDGITWTELSDSPRIREDIGSMPIQVGLWQCVYHPETEAVSALASFDNFELERKAPVSDLNGDNKVNFKDVAIFGNNWLVGPLLLDD